MEIYKILELDWLLEPEMTKALNKHIDRNVKYVVPGYQYNHRLCGFPCDIEFYQKRTLSNKILFNNIHFCSNSTLQFKASKLIDEEYSAPYYEVECGKTKGIPARIIHSDTVTHIINGSTFDSQAVLFAKSISKIEKKIDSVEVVSNKMVRIGGIADVWNHKCFDFISQTDFIELDLYALGGRISVVILSKNFDFNIQRGDYVTLEGILSLDIAINTNDNMGDFSVNEYTELIEKIDDNTTPWTYKYGIKPCFENTKKIIIDAILTKDYSKIRRCCEAKHISYRLIDVLSNLENNITYCEIKHILDSQNKYAIGHEAILMYDGEELKQALSELLTDLRLTAFKNKQVAMLKYAVRGGTAYRPFRKSVLLSRNSYHITIEIPRRPLI
jgi:hypothetical protein